MNLHRFDYSLVRFIPDPARDEAINLGVIVVSPGAESAGEFLRKFSSRLRSLDPSVDVDYVKGFVDELRSRLGGATQPLLGDDVDLIVHSSDLQRLSGVMRNQFQVTAPKTYRAATLRDAVAELFVDLVSPTRRPPSTSQGMTLAQLKRAIKRTIREWQAPGITMKESDLARARNAQHFADFWFQNGHTLAALIAIPANPEERGYAWAVRDSVPTIADEFQDVYPGFKVVAVFPPQSTESETEFLRETADFLRSRPGVLFAHADELASVRSDILPSSSERQNPEEGL